MRFFIFLFGLTLFAGCHNNRSEFTDIPPERMAFDAGIAPQFANPQQMAAQQPQVKTYAEPSVSQEEIASNRWQTLRNLEEKAERLTAQLQGLTDELNYYQGEVERLSVMAWEENQAKLQLEYASYEIAVGADGPDSVGTPSGLHAH